MLHGRRGFQLTMVLGERPLAFVAAVRIVIYVGRARECALAGGQAAAVDEDNVVFDGVCIMGAEFEALVSCPFCGVRRTLDMDCRYMLRDLDPYDRKFNTICFDRCAY
jgi:hypothetical protein